MDRETEIRCYLNIREQFSDRCEVNVLSHDYDMTRRIACGSNPWQTKVSLAGEGFSLICTLHPKQCVEWSYFAQKCIKFHPQPSRFEKFSWCRNPRTPAYRGQEGKGREGKGLKGLLPLKEGREGKDKGGARRKGGKKEGKEQRKGTLL